MDNPQLATSVSSHESENVVGGEAVCAVVDNMVPCSQTGTSLPVAGAALENISGSNGALVTIDVSSEDRSNTYSQYYCQDCLSSESKCPVTVQSEANCGDRLQSDTASSADTSSNAQNLEHHVSCSVDTELQPCAPVVAVGGAKEEELKRGLEQRLGLVLSKLAREKDNDDHRWSAQITSDFIGEDGVVQEPVSDVESTDTSDACQDIHRILMMDIVQEMDEVERYSYISFVAYAMHQLFEYSAWNEYVTFHLGWCYFPSVGTKIKCNNSLFSVRTDGNLQLNFTIFHPYEQMAPHYCPK